MKKIFLFIALLISMTTLGQTVNANSIKFAPRTVAPTPAVDGQIYFNITDGFYYYYSDGDWVPLQGNDQDNKIKQYSLIVNDANNLSVIATALNSRPQFTVADDEILLIKPNSIEFGDVVLYYSTVVLLKDLGKGTYGTGSGVTLTENDLTFIGNVNWNNDIATLATTQIIDLGDVGSDDIVTAFNGHTFTGDEDPVQNQEEGYVLINVIIDSEPLEYLFVGTGGEYGVGGTETAIADDFVLLTGNMSDGTPGLQEVLDVSGYAESSDSSSIVNFNLESGTPFDFNATNINGSYYGFYIDKGDETESEGLVLESYSNDGILRNSVTLDRDDLILSKRIDGESIVETKVIIEEPITELATFKIPAPTTDGTYYITHSVNDTEADTTGNITLTSLNPISTPDTGTVISLTTSGGNLCNMASANDEVAYTTTGTVLNAYAKVLINAASQPTVTGATLRAGATFASSTDMYMVVSYNGVIVEYYFLEL